MPPPSPPSNDPPPSQINGNLVDIHHRRIFPATITIARGIITKIIETPLTTAPATFLIPGFVDAHIHIESSMLIPTEFARLAVVHGTVATVSDPHEIANVLGVWGIQFMLDNAAATPLKIMFGAPPAFPRPPTKPTASKLMPRISANSSKIPASDTSPR